MLRTLAILVAVFGLASSDLWELYKKKYKKSYEPEEDSYRRKLFEAAAANVSEHILRYTLGFENYTPGLNAFSDQTAEEVNDLLGSDPNPSDNTNLKESKNRDHWLTLTSFKTDKAWEIFKKKYNKTYDHLEEYHRRQTFIEYVAEMTENNLRHELGLTFRTKHLHVFADIAWEEFRDTYGMKINFTDIDIHGIPTHKMSGLPLPDEADWRKGGWVTRVKNQGECKSSDIDSPDLS